MTTSIKEFKSFDAAMAAATIEKETTKKAEFKRPKNGTKTGRIWEIIEARMAANGGYLPNIAGVLEDTAAEGISPATTRTQFNKYKRMIASK